MDVTQTISRVREGDTEAFSSIVLAYQAVIRGYIAMYVFDQEDVLDLAQETFLTAFNRIDTYDTGSSFLPWLRGIARNLTLKYMRDTGRQKAREQSALEDIFHEKVSEGLENDVQGPDMGLAELKRCLDKLRRKGRSFRVVEMRYFQNMSSRQIADTIGTNEGTVRMGLMRVRQSLKKCIQRELEETGSET